MSSTRVDITFQEAETTYSKAAKAELHKDLDRAYRFYVKAAADFLHLSQTSTDGKSRSTCKSQAGKAIERAEKIKAIRPDLTPVIKDHFSEQEQVYVLRKSSVVNNVRFPLWDEDPSTSADDTSQPNLSHDQRRNHAEWRRFLTEEDQMYLPRSPLLPQDIIQHIITDCSVCGSIAVCIEHHRRFQSKIGLSCLHPQAPGGLLYSSTMGYFDFRMLFNGAYRRVRIDDKLPMYPDGSLMCMSTGNKRQIWPALLEKAYMRLMGGYDFPGSNSCIDLHALAGWIPEHLDTRSAEFQREKTWARIIDGFFKGHCLLTLGTGENVSASEPTAVALLPAHCYAVIDVHGTTEDRRLTVLDTWVQPSTSESSVTDFIQGLASSREQLRPSRTFDISWDRACQVFDGIYLSWDPGIFRNQLVFHGMWESVKVPGGQNRSCHFRLQLRTEIDQITGDGHEVWLLLTRHTQDTRRQSEYISLLVDSESDSTILANDLRSAPLKGEYSNSIHVLAKMRVSTPTAVSSLTASYDGDMDDVGFTITVYSHATMSWIEDAAKTLHVKQIDGAFTSKTAGGSHGCPTFLDNPQYHLRIYPPSQASSPESVRVKAHTTFVVQGPRELPMNASLVWSQGERVAEMGPDKIAATTGPYSYGYAQSMSDLPVGDYTLIVSAFEPHRLGQFFLRVGSSHRFDIAPIPQEGAGMFSRVIRDAWTAENAGGSPSFKKYMSNPLYEIQVASQTQLKIRLQLIEPSPAISVNITLFQLAPRSLSLGVLVATSGPYSDATGGAVTPQITLQPGTYFAVPSTYNPGVTRAFRLLVYSSTTNVKVEPVRQLSVVASNPI